MTRFFGMLIAIKRLSSARKTSVAPFSIPSASPAASLFPVIKQEHPKCWMIPSTACVNPPITPWPAVTGITATHSALKV